ncbi:MAG: hypothetical protein FWG02_11390 [Holophagaceae bacterium]|nr:hypothetical protein [Holophagaceae bacterium]
MQTLFRFPKPEEGYYQIEHVVKNGTHMFTDRGNTHKILDKIFDLGSYDVQKNMSRVLGHFGIKRMPNSKEYVAIIEDWDDLWTEGWEANAESKLNSVFEEARHRLLYCISFLEAMDIFYN